MVVTEHALEGTKEIAEYLGLSPGTVSSLYIPKLKAAGIIFTRMRGITPHRQFHIYTFPSLIQRFLQKEEKKKITKTHKPKP